MCGIGDSISTLSLSTSPQLLLIDAFQELAVERFIERHVERDVHHALARLFRQRDMGRRDQRGEPDHETPHATFASLQVA